MLQMKRWNNSIFMIWVSHFTLMFAFYFSLFFTMTSSLEQSSTGSSFAEITQHKAVEEEVSRWHGRYRNFRFLTVNDANNFPISVHSQAILFLQFVAKCNDLLFRQQQTVGLLLGQHWDEPETELNGQYVCIHAVNASQHWYGLCRHVKLQEFLRSTPRCIQNFHATFR